MARIGGDIPVNNVVFVTVVGGACGSSFLAIVYKTSETYGAAFVFGYGNEPQRIRLFDGTWEAQ